MTVIQLPNPISDPCILPLSQASASLTNISLLPSKMPGLKTIIALSFVSLQRYSYCSPLMIFSANLLRQVLAIGFLLVILSAALWHNYLPLLVVATYVIAPIPNWICSRCASSDDFMESSNSGVVDFGRWFTGFLVVMGIGTLRRLLHLKDAFYTTSVPCIACILHSSC